MNLDEYKKASYLPEELKNEITQDKFDKLLKIYNSYKEEIEENLEDISNVIVNKLKKIKEAHIVHSRIKDPIKVLDKILRKADEQDFLSDDYDYLKELNDLIGIRILHFYKEDWKYIDQGIVKPYEKYINKTEVRLREGDFSGIYENYDREIPIKRTEAGYRSVHYEIGYPHLSKIYRVEIQVRTLFEEAWSEIDHDLKYPNYNDDEVLNKSLQVLNRIAGSADEMSSVLKELKENYNVNELKKEIQRKDEENNQLKEQLKEEKYKKSEVEKEVFVPLYGSNYQLNSDSNISLINPGTNDLVYNFGNPLTLKRDSDYTRYLRYGTEELSATKRISDYVRDSSYMNNYRKDKDDKSDD